MSSLPSEEEAVLNDRKAKKMAKARFNQAVRQHATEQRQREQEEAEIRLARASAKTSVIVWAVNGLKGMALDAYRSDELQSLAATHASDMITKKADEVIDMVVAPGTTNVAVKGITLLLTNKFVRKAKSWLGGF